MEYSKHKNVTVFLKNMMFFGKLYNDLNPEVGRSIPAAGAFLTLCEL